MPINPYAIELLLGLVRLILATGVLYGAAFCLFPLRTAAWMEAPPSERRMARLLLTISVSTLLVQGLVSLHLYDDLMFVGCLLLAMIGALWGRHRDGGGTALYVRLLKWVDQRQSIRLFVAHARKRISSGSLLGGTLLGGVVLGSAILRLTPHLSSPAPFSIVYYRLLEITKHLQINQLFPGSMIEERGFHSLALVLLSLSVVDMGIVVRLLGVLAALFIVMGIYGTTLSYSGDAGAALCAAGLFGLGILLPLTIENQVESTPVLLAAAYALPTWYLLLRYQINGVPSYLCAGSAGLVLLLLTEGSIAALMFGVVGGLSLLQCLWTPPSARARRESTHLRRALTVAGLCGGGGLLLWGFAVLRRSVVVPDPFSVPTFSVSGARLPLSPAELPMSTYGGLVGITALALFVSALTEQNAFRRLTNWALAVSCLGLYGVWHYLDTLPVDLPPMAPVALLSLFLTVGLGGLLARTATLIRGLFRRTRRKAALRPLYFGSVSGLLLLSVLASPPPLAPTPKSAVEPAGYVRAYYQIQREGTPYQWTVVSHHGTAVRAMNQGRFLTYEYFLQHYDAATYDHTSDAAVPTTDLFLFIPTDSAMNHIRAELLVSPTETRDQMQRWCEKYRQRTGTLSVFYRDEHLTVYRLSRSPHRTQQPPPLSPQLAQDDSPGPTSSPPVSPSSSPRP